MAAPSKDDVYNELRRQGIRAIRVDERIAPVVRRGFRGLRKREWSFVACVAIVVFAVAGAVGWIFASNRHVETGPGGQEISLGRRAYRLATSRPRHQMPGVDVRLVAESGFDRASDAFLARFAQPGIIVGGEPTMDEIVAIVDDLADSLEDEVVIAKGDSAELADLKRVVSGIRDEVRMLVRGGRSVGEAVRYLVERSRMEIRYAADVQNGEGSQVEKAEKLRSMGLPDGTEENSKYPLAPGENF